MKFQRDSQREEERRVNRICGGRDWGTETSGCEGLRGIARGWRRGWRNFAQPRNGSFRARTIPRVCTRVSENSAAKMPGKTVVVCEGRALAFRLLFSNVINPFVLSQSVRTSNANFVTAVQSEYRQERNVWYLRSFFSSSFLNYLIYLTQFVEF